LIVDNQILTQHDSITVWIEAQGTINQWDEEDDGSAVFLIDEVRATSEPLSFEFLDHSHQTTKLGCALALPQGILYVSTNTEEPGTKVTIVDDNCKIKILGELSLRAFDTSIQEVNHSTQFVVLQNFDGWDLVYPGFIGILVENGEVKMIEESFSPFSDMNPLGFNVFTESVIMDSLGALIIDTEQDGFYQYKDSILTELTIEGDLFLNNQKDWFVYNETELFYFDGTSSIQLLTDQDIIGIEYAGLYNYILSSDSLYRYDEQFSAVKTKWVLPQEEMSFEQILMSDSQITFLLNDKEEFTIIDVLETETKTQSFPKDTTEKLSLLSFQESNSIMLAGSYSIADVFDHLFFREFSREEINEYDRVDLSLDEFKIEYDTTSYHVDPIVTSDTSFYDVYEMHTFISNHQDRRIVSLNGYSKPYQNVFGWSDYLDVSLEEEIAPFGTYFSNDEISEVSRGSVNESLLLYITGANFKFNASNERSQLPDFTASVSSISDLNIKIFPNPFTDYFTIESSDDFHSWCLYDISGRLIYVSSDLEPLSRLAELEAGSYLFQVLTLDGQLHNEIVVKI